MVSITLGSAAKNHWLVFDNWGETMGVTYPSIGLMSLLTDPGTPADFVTTIATNSSSGGTMRKLGRRPRRLLAKLVCSRMAVTPVCMAAVESAELPRLLCGAPDVNSALPS